MERIKGINVLIEQLVKFQEEIIYSLSCELKRIGRRVTTHELKYNPFLTKSGLYVQSLRLDENQKVICNISVSRVKEKPLVEFIISSEIDCYGLLDMLQLLKAIPGKNGALPSILTPVSGEIISNDELDRDAWICVCGNTPDHGGFYSCDQDGDHIEPGDEWESLYRCNDCGRVIDDRDHKVIGINLNPNDEEIYHEN